MTEETYDAALALLDRQIVSSDGWLIGKVDDLAIQQDTAGGWYVTDLLVGPSALGARTGGVLGRLMEAVWGRLSAHPENGPASVPFEKVTRIESAVHLSLSRDEAGLEGFETWVRTHIIERIPGHR